MVHLKGRKVLLVEDHEVNRILVSSILDRWDIKSDWVENGKEAIEQVQKDKYDLILMDMQMPVMDGLEATRRIRRDLELEIPIIALTANVLKEDTKKCFDAGMNDFLSKPFKPSVLYNKIVDQLYRTESGSDPTTPKASRDR